MTKQRVERPEVAYGNGLQWREYADQLEHDLEVSRAEAQAYLARIEADATHISNLTTEVERLRELLWLLHGCPIPALYGDDGEMSCGSCMIDFKRQTPDEIRESFAKYRSRRASLTPPDDEPAPATKPCRYCVGWNLAFPNKPCPSCGTISVPEKENESCPARGEPCDWVVDLVSPGDGVYCSVCGRQKNDNIPGTESGMCKACGYYAANHDGYCSQCQRFKPNQ